MELIYCRREKYRIKMSSKICRKFLVDSVTGISYLATPILAGVMLYIPHIITVILSHKGAKL